MGDNALAPQRPRRMPMRNDASDVGEATGFVNQWLENTVKMYESGALHPSVMRKLAPVIDALVRSDRKRHGVVSDDPRLDDPNAAIEPYGRTPAQYVGGGMQGGVPAYVDEADYGPAASEGDPFYPALPSKRRR